MTSVQFQDAVWFDRLVGAVLHCLDEVRSEMAEQCSSADVVTQYDLHLINPVVELTRSFVVAQCTMTEQYRQYFAVTSGDTCRTASTCSSIVALAVAEWLAFQVLS